MTQLAWQAAPTDIRGGDTLRDTWGSPSITGRPESGAVTLTAAYSDTAVKRHETFACVSVGTGAGRKGWDCVAI